MLVGVMSGPRFPTSWLAGQDDMGFFDAKGVLESIFGQLGIQVAYQRSTDATLHPGRTASVSCGDVALGIVGEVHPSILERFGLEGRTVAMFEINVSALSQVMPEGGFIYESTSRFPEAYRDIAVLVGTDVTSTQIQRVIDRHKLVVHSTPFDIYSGTGVPEGKKSIAYRITFQSDRSTLTSDQVDRAQGDILRQLEREVKAELRS